MSSASFARRSLGAPGTGAVFTVASDILWAAAILLLTIGVTRESSVVARRPLGLAAAAVVALWPVTRTLVQLFAPPWSPEQADAWLFWMYLSMALPVIAGAIAAVQIARAKVAPRPWNWAPLWVIAGQALLWAIPQIVAVSAPSVIVLIADTLAAVGTLSFLASTLGLGSVAIVLAGRSRAGTVDVYTSRGTQA